MVGKGCDRGRPAMLPTFSVGALAGQEGFLEEREGAVAPYPREDPVAL